MDTAVVACSTETRPNFRAYVEERISKVTQFYPRTQRVDVELTRERDPRQADAAGRIELIIYDKDLIVRVEAGSADHHAAVGIAAGRLFEHLRRVRDRTKDHGRRYPHELNETEVIGEVTPVEKVPVPEAPVHLRSAENLKAGEACGEQLGDSPIIVRQKVHGATLMTVNEALDQMETVGHPFFLSIDKDTKQPCVVYHRHGWTYGVLRLNTTVE